MLKMSFQKLQEQGGGAKPHQQGTRQHSQQVQGYSFLIDLFPLSKLHSLLCGYFCWFLIDLRPKFSAAVACGAIIILPDAMATGVVKRLGKHKCVLKKVKSEKQ